MEHVSDIIKAIPSDPIALSGVLLIASGLLAYRWFTQEKLIAKIIVFFAIFGGGALILRDVISTDAPVLPNAAIDIQEPRTLTKREEISNAFRDGKTCSVVFSASITNLGTIAVNSTYTIKFVGGGNWEVSGINAILDRITQTDTYSGGEPENGPVSVWGKNFDLKENGKLSAQENPNFGGLLICP